jgi:pyruvate dehydrogenase E1 component alpha subunit
MSDPQKYRTKDEVEEYKQKDPIEQVKATILSKKYATEAQLEEVNDSVKAEVDESVEFAEQSNFPDNSELYKDIYKQEDYPFLTDY